jgi:aminoglycoside 6'-N-acetyltransferase I
MKLTNVLQIIDFSADREDHILQAAEMLFAGFKEYWPCAWPTMTAALSEVRESFGPGRINRIAVSGDRLLGWVGALRQYSGHTWELHPLVVQRDCWRTGIGRSLVTDLENRVRDRGGITIYLGTDDEAGMTTLSNIDLYPDIPRHLANLRNLRDHPFEFYQKLGYVVVGVIPDANGRGKPDILMAKRIAD